MLRASTSRGDGPHPLTSALARHFLAWGRSGVQCTGHIVVRTSTHRAPGGIAGGGLSDLRAIDHARALGIGTKRGLTETSEV